MGRIIPGPNIEGDTNINGDLSVTGNLTVSGSTTTLETESLVVADMIILNDGQTDAGVTLGISGIQIDRGSLTDFQLIFDESDDTIKYGEIGSLVQLALISIKEITTTPYSVLPSDNVLLINMGKCVNNLAVSLTNDSKTLRIKNSGGDAGIYNITINPDDSGTIGGPSFFVPDEDYVAIDLMPFGTNWSVL